MPGSDFAQLGALTPSHPDWQVDWSRIWPLWPELAALDHCPQDPQHHAEGDAGTHTRMVVEALVADPEWRSLEPEDRAVLFWAAVLHDIAKPASTRHEPNGRITSPGHSRSGSAMARSLFWQMAAPFRWREAVCAIIAHHQLPFWLIARSAPERLAIETSWRCRADHLCVHARADAKGRICADQADILVNVALAREQFAELDCLAAPFPFANDESRVAFFERPDRDPRYAAHAEFRCRVTVMSALPGSGKDTWISQNRPDLPVVSLDALRAEIGVPATANQGRVIQAAQEAARRHLRAGQDFVWNATNVTRQIRARVLRLLRDYGAHIEIVYLEPPIATLFGRNRARADAVSEDVIRTLARKLEPPGHDEAHCVVHVLG